MKTSSSKSAARWALIDINPTDTFFDSYWELGFLLGFDVMKQYFLSEAQFWASSALFSENHWQELVLKMRTALCLPVRKTVVLTNIAFSHRLLYQILSGCATNRAVHDCVLFGCTLLFGHQNRKSGEMTRASSRGGGSPLFPVTVKRSPLRIWSGVTVLHQTHCQLFVYSLNPQSPNAPQIHSHKHISYDNYDVQISCTTQEDTVWCLKAWPCFVSLRWLFNKV